MENKNRFFRGILGGFLFGLLASIPWILVYFFLNYFIAYLGALIGIGVVYGYKMFTDTLDKKMPIFVSIITLFIITLISLVIVPGVLLLENGIPLSLDNYIFLYQIEGMLPSLLKEYFISILFAALGAGGYIYNVYLQIRNNQSDIKITSNTYSLVIDYLLKIKDYFIKNNATDKEHLLAITDDLGFDKLALKMFIAGKALVEIDGLYYFDLEKGDKVIENYKLANYDKNKSFRKILIVCIIVIVGCLLISFLQSL